jgi:hypothetical protein
VHAGLAPPGARDCARFFFRGHVDSERFPYWVKRLGMDDALVATFAILDFAKNKLIVAPAEVTLDGDAAAGWTMSIDQNSPVFPCLIA